MSSTVASALRRLLIAMLFTAPAFGQGGSVIRQVIAPNSAQNGTGQPASYALIRVCPSTATGFPCSPVVPYVYQDQALTEQLPSAFAADINGNYQFFIGTGEYQIQETNAVGAGYTFAYSWLVFVNGTGTVSGINLTLPSSIFYLSGSPCSGGPCNLTASLVNQPAYTIFGNFSGSSATPSFGTLTSGMIPATLDATVINGLGVAGNETVSGTLAVTSDTALASTLEVTGLATLGPLTATTTSLSSLGVSGNTSLTGTLNVSGLSTLASLGVTSSATIGGSLSVAGDVTFNGPLAASGAIYSSTSLGAPLTTSATLNATVGYQIGGSYGLAGQCLISTGAGTAFETGCGLGGTPTLTVDSGAGSGATAVLGGWSLDRAGSIYVTTGTAPSTAGFVTVTFSVPFANTSYCVVSPAEVNAAGVNDTVFVNGGLAPATQFILTANPALTGATSYQWNYHCDGH